MNIVVLISGTGSNLKAIIDAIQSHQLQATLLAVIADRDCAGLAHAHHAGIPSLMLDRKLPDFAARLEQALPDCDLIVLAGWLSVIPTSIVQKFHKKIINLHPSLLPKFGGMGMYGRRVHEAVIAAAERESGCSVHWVDEGVDTGEVIAQAKVPVLADDTPEALAKRVQAEEHALLLRCLRDLSER